MAVDVYDGVTFLGTAQPQPYAPWAYFTPSVLKDNQVHTINVYYSGTTVVLAGSPMSLQCAASASGYAYAYADPFSSINATYWNKTGVINTYNQGGLENGSSSSAGQVLGKSALTSLIATGQDYEVSSTLAIQPCTQTCTGWSYTQYLRAAPDLSSYFAVTLAVTNYTVPYPV